MSKPSLRIIIKSGPLSSVYAKVRGIKRSLKGEPIAGFVPQTVVPMGLSELLLHRKVLGGHPRFHYSLGLAYRERNASGDFELAVQSLQMAIKLGFESPERVRLYLADLQLAAGCNSEAKLLIAELTEMDFTSDELIVFAAVKSVVGAKL